MEVTKQYAVRLHVLCVYSVLYYNYYHYSCTGVQFGVEDLHTYAHLLSVALNSKLCQGREQIVCPPVCLTW